MKILLIHQFFVSPREPGHTRHFEMARFLQKKGHDLIIVSSNINYQTGKPITKFDGYSYEKNISGVKIIRVRTATFLHRNYFSRIIVFLSFMLNSIRAALKIPDVDLVMGTTPPLFQSFSAWLVSFIKRKPFLLEVRDLWPEFAVSMKVIQNPFLIALAQGLEKFLYKKATHILVNSPAYIRFIRNKRIPSQKITFIPYGTDTEMFNPEVDGRVVRKELGLRNEFLVLYAGALGQANDIYTVLKAAKRLEKQENIRFVLFGDGKERPNLQKEAKRQESSNVIFAGVSPKNGMPSVLAAADICLAILMDVPMFHTTYPNKVFDYMAAGKATVLVIDGVIRKVIEQSRGGIFVQPGDDHQLADVILKLALNREISREMGNNARKYALKHLDRNDKMEETLELYKKIIPHSH
jgi:glycosyltransferase involved in cell wall biosynthesis